MAVHERRLELVADGRTSFRTVDWDAFVLVDLIPELRARFG